MIDTIAPPKSNKRRGLSSLRLRKLKLYEQKPVCAYCRKPVRLTGQPRTERASLDHKQPRSKGGTNRWSNLALACRLCNGCKDDRTPQQWAADVLAPVTSGWRGWLVGLVLRWLVCIAPVAFLAGCGAAPEPGRVPTPPPAPVAPEKPVETPREPRSQPVTESENRSQPARGLAPVRRHETRFEETIGGVRLEGAQSVEVGPGGVTQEQTLNVTP